MSLAEAKGTARSEENKPGTIRWGVDPAEEKHDDHVDSLIASMLEMAFITNYTKPIINRPQGKLMQVVTNLMKTVANSLLKDEDKAMRAKGYQDDKGEDTQLVIEEVQARRLKADCDEFRAAITADVVKIWKSEQEKK